MSFWGVLLWCPKCITLNLMAVCLRIQYIKKSFYSSIIKLVYSELNIINNELELDKMNFDDSQNYIIQKIIKGITGSISAVSNSRQMHILSINKQIIDLDDFSYKGGIINYNFPDKEKLKALFLEVQKTYPQLNGYFGIDFIYADQEFYLLEINPRITSSIIGLAELGNPAKLILDLIDKNIFNKTMLHMWIKINYFEFTKTRKKMILKNLFIN